jgi:hypothetical protein
MQRKQILAKIAALKQTLAELKQSEAEKTITADSIRDDFAQDRSGDLAKIESICAEIHDSHAVSSPALIAELFRLVHTVKGNAAAFGFEAVMQYAHKVEEVLSSVRADIETGSTVYEEKFFKFMGDCARRFGVIRQALASGGVAGQALETRKKKQTEPRYLKTVVGGRPLLVPCDSISEVVRRPRLMAIPGGHPGWLGLIHARDGLVPLVELVTGTKQLEWVVVLKQMLSIPVEDFGEVLAMPSDPTVEVLDMDKMRERAVS